MQADRNAIVQVLVNRPAVDWQLIPVQPALSSEVPAPPAPAAPRIDWEPWDGQPPAAPAPSPVSSALAPAPAPPPLPVSSAPAPPPAPARVSFPAPRRRVRMIDPGLGYSPRILSEDEAPMMTVVNFDGARQESDMALAARFHGYMPEQKQQIRQMHRQPANRAPGPRFQAEMKIETFPTREIEQVDKESTTECSICFEAWQAAQKVRTLPCFHYFHVGCIDQWLRQNMSCPQCRLRL